MDYIIALSKDPLHHELVDNGTTVRSRIIYIPIGYTALLSLYNMSTIIKMEGEEGKKELVNRSCLTVKKLSFGPTGDVADMLFDLCSQRISLIREHQKLLSERRIFSEPVIQNCCAWSIDPANNYALVPIPGFYVLETKDVDQLDTMYVEYSLLTAEQARAIPDNFKLGN